MAISPHCSAEFFLQLCQSSFFVLYLWHHILNTIRGANTIGLVYNHHWKTSERQSCLSPRGLMALPRKQCCY
ncbi:hypothetical protein M758_UG013500 [Ceratodon purpureus]|nr:hypothetical protein M758_UG013500 [Ceratodon purpureus]